MDAIQRGAFVRPALIGMAMLLSSAQSVHADTYTIAAGSIDKAVEIYVPAEFRLAGTGAELARRERLLNFYRLNSAIRGTYTEIFRANWDTVYPYPAMVVSTLATTKNMQGKISEEDWMELRALFRNSSTSQIAKYREQYQPGIRSNMPVDYSVLEEMMWAATSFDDRTVVMLLSEWQSEDTRYIELSARTVLYHDGYLIVLDFKEDASKPGAAARLRDWVSETRVISVGE